MDRHPRGPASSDAERYPRALIQSCLAASAAWRRISSWSTRTARPSSTTTRPSTMTISTSRPWPTCTKLPSTSVAGVRWARRIVEDDEIGLLAHRQRSDVAVQAQGAGAVESRHAEDVLGLPEVGDRTLLQAADVQSPAHDLHHVSMHVVRREGDARARVAAASTSARRCRRWRCPWECGRR